MCKICFGDLSSCVLGCRFMIRGRSAGPCMISRFEHKSLLCKRKCVFVPCAKPAVYNDLQRRYMLWRSQMDHGNVLQELSCVSFILTLSEERTCPQSPGTFLGVNRKLMVCSAESHRQVQPHPQCSTGISSPKRIFPMVKTLLTGFFFE